MGGRHFRESMGCGLVVRCRSRDRYESDYADESPEKQNRDSGYARRAPSRRRGDVPLSLLARECDRRKENHRDLRGGQARRVSRGREALPWTQLSDDLGICRAWGDHPLLRDARNRRPHSSRRDLSRRFRAQYLDGTTDITRTVLLGKKASAEQRDRFTRVLQGHIRLGRVRFPRGVTGGRLDTLARTALWNIGLDYNHGTGHGVGSFLNVHEGPRSISSAKDTGLPIEAGNIFSNEPGYYKPGEYGIRLENLVLVKEAARGNGFAGENGLPYYEFETLTLCPIDTRLVDAQLLVSGGTLVAQ